MGVEVCLGVSMCASYSSACRMCAPWVLMYVWVLACGSCVAHVVWPEAAVGFFNSFTSAIMRPLQQSNGMSLHHMRTASCVLTFDRYLSQSSVAASLLSLMQGQTRLEVLVQADILLCALSLAADRPSLPCHPILSHHVTLPPALSAAD